MKIKTSITLSTDVLARIDRHTGDGGSRSSFIEHVLREHFDRTLKRQIHKRDLERINAAAGRLNREALDVLEDQAME